MLLNSATAEKALIGEEHAWWERWREPVLRDVTHERKGREGAVFRGEEHA